MIGKQLGPYQIIDELGAGGMGEVYKARDTRLDRVVAIKVLAPHVAADPTFRDRFEREARAISALDHPNICTLYDLGEAVPSMASGPESTATPVQFIVMQYLEGETLADRLTRAAQPKSDPGMLSSVKSSSLMSMARGPIPLDQTLRFAAQIAEALDAAHRRGIVHRDLKPGNVMLTKAGVKLLDFGLAKLRIEPAVAGGLTMAATHAAPLTSEGSLLGTLQYMSPEQLHSGDIDTRSDIFAFGAILFEMLTGRRVFEGKSQAGTIAAILENDPPPLTDLADVRTTLPPSAHRALERLLRKSLEKNPDDRWQSAADLADELKWIDQDRLRAAGDIETIPNTAARSAETARATKPGSLKWWVLSTVVALLAAIGLASWMFFRPAPVAETTRFLIAAPDGRPFPSPGGIAVSPDGRKVAFVVGQSEQAQIWIRGLDSVMPKLLAGSDNAWQPFWSPDGRFIAFQDRTGGTKIKRIDISGGPPLTLVENSGGTRATWSPSGVILFKGTDGALYQIPESGGQPTQVTELDKTRQESGHDWPLFLPDGRRFIYLAQSSSQANIALFLGSLDSKERTHLVDVQSSAEYSNGYLLYQREGTLMAQPFDAKQGRLTGGAMPIVENIVYNAVNGRAAVSASPTGVLVYLTGDAVGATLLTWHDTTGKASDVLGPEGNYLGGWLNLSPNGDRVAVTKSELGVRPDIWVIDSARQIPTRFTFDTADDTNPIWSPDGQSIVFRSNRKGNFDLYRRSSGGAGSEETLFASAENKLATGFSPDGKVLLFTRDMGAGKKNDVWALPMTGDRKPYPVIATPYNEGYAVFSPDGRWIAYDSDDAGLTQVYVQSFPPNSAKIRLSTSDGRSAHWSADGKRIVYITGNYHMMSVDVTSTGDTFHAGVPQELFAQSRNAGNPRFFAVDGTLKRFLIPLAKAATAAPSPLTVVLNWSTGLGVKTGK